MLVRAAVPSGNEALDPCSKRTTVTMQSVNLERRLAYLFVRGQRRLSNPHPRAPLMLVKGMRSFWAYARKLNRSWREVSTCSRHIRDSVLRSSQRRITQFPCADGMPQ